MTVLSVVQNVCLAVGLTRPDVVMTSQDREMLEMVRLANEVAIQIRDAEFDWQALSKIYTVTGNGSLSAFPLPDDYCRMTVAGNIWSSRWSWGLNKVPSLDEWIEKQVVPYTSVTGDWIIFGNELNIQPVMAGTEYVKFPYISNLIVNQPPEICRIGSQPIPIHSGCRSMRSSSGLSGRTDRRRVLPLTMTKSASRRLFIRR